MRQKFLASFPEEVRDRMVSFNDMGQVAVAWTSESIEVVIDWITRKNAAILGGRVFMDAEEMIFFTGLEWTVERNELFWNEFVQKSAKVSLSFIKKNQSLRLEKYLYVLNFVEEEEMITRSNLPMHFPETLINAACWIDTIEHSEISWKYEDILQAVNFYVENHYGILGGDVYTCNRDNISPTTDSWYYNFKNYNLVEDIANSRDKTLGYIENYHRRNGDDYCYTLVVRFFDL